MPLTMLPHWSEPPIWSAAVVAAGELGEVVGLQDHVVELEEGQLVLAVEAELDRIDRQHAVDREVAADIAQEVDVVERRQPLGVVDHDRGVRPPVEVDEVGEGRLEALLVGLDLVVGEELARLVLARRVADARRAAAHQRDRPVAGLLEPAQHHDREQVADVEARRRAVEADIGGDHALGETPASSPSGSEHWWMKPRSDMTRRKSDLNSVIGGNPLAGAALRRRAAAV